jgi:hypothetical protein
MCFFAWSATAADNGVLSTYMSLSGTPPVVSVAQSAAVNGVLRYDRLLQDEVEIPVTVYGGCNFNFRVQTAYASTYYQEADGTDVFLEAGPPGTYYSPSFPVNQDADHYGPTEVKLRVGREFLEEWMSAQGEALVDELAESSAFTEAELRQTQISTLVHFRPTLYFGCRRYAFGDGKRWQTSRAELPIHVNFLPADNAGGNLDDLRDNPGDGVAIPVPVSELTARTRIEQNSFLLTPEPTHEPCGYALSGAFVTNQPANIRYRIEDHLGALSPEFVTETGITKTSFVSHEIDFSAETGEPLGFSANEQPPSDGGLLFGDSLLNRPTDRIQGYFRVITTAPHHSKSNIVSYNLEECSSESMAAPAVFGAQIVTDLDGANELIGKYRKRIAAGKRKGKARKQY